MKQYCFGILILFSICVTAQTNNYIDSINEVLKPLSANDQLKKIVAIPNDKYVSNLPQSEELILNGKEIAIKLSDSLSLADIFLQMARISTYKDEREKKLIYSLNAIKIYENLNEVVKAGIAYGELGYVLKSENMDNALLYMRKSMNLLESVNNVVAIDPVYDNYGILQFMNEKYDSAIYYHHKSLALKKFNKDDIGLGYGYAHLAVAHTAIKKFSIARKYIDSSSVIRTKLNDAYGIAVNFTHRADIYFAEENYTMAIENYKTSRDLAAKGNFYYLRKYCIELLTQSYLELGNYKQAFEHNVTFQSLKDSTLNAQTNSRVAELQIEFETEKKEKEISIQKEEILAQELDLKNKNLYSIILAACLIIFGLVAYTIFRKKQQLSKELLLKDALSIARTQNKLQEQRLRISRDLHDNIGSQLTFIISSIDNLNFLTKSSEVNIKEKLSSINIFASNTISQLRDTIWAMNKNKIPYEDFHTRLLGLIENTKTVKEKANIQLKSNIESNIVFSSFEGITIFRVLQESMNNAIKYSNATLIEIKIFEDLKTIKFQFSDNGIGFDLNTIELGNGLKNMQKRIEEIEGEININTEPNSGTKIEFSILKNT